MPVDGGRHSPRDELVALADVHVGLYDGTGLRRRMGDLSCIGLDLEMSLLLQQLITFVVVALAAVFLFWFKVWPKLAPSLAQWFLSRGHIKLAVKIKFAGKKKASRKSDSSCH
jgi:hypothetical protein